MPATKGITSRQKIFCELYLNPNSECCGNATKSYQKAGFNADNAGKQSYLLMQRSEIKDYIAQLEEKRLESFGVISREAYLQEGLDTVRELPRTSAVRVKYYDIVGKVLGFFSDAVSNQIMIYADENSSEKDSVKIGTKLRALASMLKNPVNTLNSPQS